MAEKKKDWIAAFKAHSPGAFAEYEKKIRADERTKILQENFLLPKNHEYDIQTVDDAIREACDKRAETERIEFSKLFALEHAPCGNPKCLCNSKEFEQYWKGAGIERRTHVPECKCGSTAVISLCQGCLDEHNDGIEAQGSKPQRSGEFLIRLNKIIGVYEMGAISGKPEPNRIAKLVAMIRDVYLELHSFDDTRTEDEWHRYWEHYVDNSQLFNSSNAGCECVICRHFDAAHRCGYSSNHCGRCDDCIDETAQKRLSMTTSTFQKKINYLKKKCGFMQAKLGKRKRQATITHHMDEEFKQLLGKETFFRVIRVAQEKASQDDAVRPANAEKSLFAPCSCSKGRWIWHQLIGGKLLCVICGRQLHCNDEMCGLDYGHKGPHRLIGAADYPPRTEFECCICGERNSEPYCGRHHRSEHRMVQKREG